MRTENEKLRAENERLIAENDALKEELGSFDMAFFDEIEDLKYKSNQLVNEKTVSWWFVYRNKRGYF